MGEEDQVITRDSQQRDQAAPDATLEQIADELEIWYELVGRQFGPLSRPQRRMLRVVAKQQMALRVSELAVRLGLTSAGATRMLDTLENLGYIDRYRSPETDQRQVYVALTDAGQSALAAADTIYRARVTAAARRLTATESTTLAALLAKLIDAAPPNPTEKPPGSNPEAEPVREPTGTAPRHNRQPCD